MPSTYPSWPQVPERTEDTPSDRREVMVMEDGTVLVHSFYHFDAAEFTVGHIMDSSELDALIAFVVAELGKPINFPYGKTGVTELVELVGLPDYVWQDDHFRVTVPMRRVQ